MPETQKLARVVRILLITFVIGGAFGVVRGAFVDPEPYKVHTYCSGHDKVYIADNGSFEVLPASMDCVNDPNGG